MPGLRRLEGETKTVRVFKEFMIQVYSTYFDTTIYETKIQEQDVVGGLKLVGRYLTKMEQYINAARDILTPKDGYGLVDELKWAGYWINIVLNKPHVVEAALGSQQRKQK
nr:zinc finger (C2H2 type) family protein [Tanacetum cinerariifolium]